MSGIQRWRNWTDWMWSGDCRSANRAARRSAPINTRSRHRVIRQRLQRTHPPRPRHRVKLSRACRPALRSEDDATPSVPEAVKTSPIFFALLAAPALMAQTSAPDQPLAPIPPLTPLPPIERLADQAQREAGAQTIVVVFSGPTYTMTGAFTINP